MQINHGYATDYIAIKDGIVGYVPITKSGGDSSSLASVSAWYYKEPVKDPKPPPMMYQIDASYQVLTNDNDYHKSTETGGEDRDSGYGWIDEGTMFYVVDLKRDDKGNVLYIKDTAGKTSLDCPVSKLYEDPCPTYINKKNIKGYLPLISGSTTTENQKRLLYDYIFPERASDFSLATHLYTTVPFKDEDTRTPGYKLNGILGAIYVPSPISSLNISADPEKGPTEEDSLPPSNTVPLYRYYVCSADNYFQTYMYSTDSRELKKLGITIDNTLKYSGNSKPLYDEKYELASNSQIPSEIYGEEEVTQPPSYTRYTACSPGSHISLIKEVDPKIERLLTLNDSNKKHNVTTVDTNELNSALSLQTIKNSKVQSTLLPVNHTNNSAPIAKDVIANDQSSINNNYEVTFLATDQDQNDDLSATIVSNPTYGELGEIDQQRGTVIYTPNEGFSGTDTFTYKVSDGKSESNVATATIDVSDVNNDSSNENNQIKSSSQPSSSNDSEIKPDDHIASDPSLVGETTANKSPGTFTPSPSSPFKLNEPQNSGCNDPDANSCKPAVERIPGEEGTVVTECDGTTFCPVGPFGSANTQVGSPESESPSPNDDVSLENSNRSEINIPAITTIPADDRSLSLDDSASSMMSNDGNDDTEGVNLSS